MADREKVIRECNWAIDQILVNGFTTLMTKGFFRDVITLLKAQPEVVRCKDCKHRPELKLYSDRQGNYTAVEFPDGSKCPCQCEDFFYSWYPNDDWFCANGEQEE